MIWNGWMNRVHSDPEDGFEPSIVEPGESLPTRLLVERMMNAGVATSIHNAMIRMYEFGPDSTVPEGFLTPQGTMSSDVIDVMTMKRYLDARIRGNKEAAAAIAAEQAAKKAAALAAAQPDPTPAQEG